MHYSFWEKSETGNMERALISCRREGIGSRLRLLLFVILCFLFLFIRFGSGFAADDACQTVETHASPGDTTIDIFDYSVYTTGNNPTHTNQVNPNNLTGINEGHTLWFVTNTDGYKDQDIWNYWTRYEGGVTQGIVKPILGSNGFPDLNCGGTVTQYRPPNDPRNFPEQVVTQELTCTVTNENLSYLFEVPEGYSGPFDKDDPLLSRYGSNGKVNWQAYPDVDYLFTVDNNGNYYFNSQYHKALMDRDTGQIKQPMCKHTETSSSKYGFYPFSETGIRPANATGNVAQGWFFGVHINVDFSIPYDYMVTNPSGEQLPMVYNFIGDDDVWVYIDGILIGDVGGIHSRQDLSIDFQTGKVVINSHDHPNDKLKRETTIFDMVKQAYEYKYGDTLTAEEIWDLLFTDFDWNDNENPTTFRGNTYHTLDFFYLERGAGGSNMEMQYNLVSTLDFGAHKALHIGNHKDAERLDLNQFRYRLTGLHCPYATNTDLEVVMPKDPFASEIHYWSDYEPRNKSLIQSPFNYGTKTLIAGNSADGNINFGRIDLEGTEEDRDSEFAQYIGQTFCYVVDELPPAGAEPDGGYYIYKGVEIRPDSDGRYTFDPDEGPISIDYNEPMDPSKLPPYGAVYTGNYSYKGETITPNADGTYTFDDIIYDNEVFYFRGTVDRRNWLNKTFTRPDFTVDEDDPLGVYYADFHNRYNFPEKVVLNATKRYQTVGNKSVSLTEDQFTFTLTDITGESPVDIQTDIGNAAANNGNGKVTFDPIVYTLKDNIPADQTVATYTYKITETTGSQPWVVYSNPAEYYAQVTLTDTSDQTGTASMNAAVTYYKKRTSGCPSSSVQFNDENGELACFDKINQVTFTNKCTTLIVDKKVTGNIGSRNKVFDFSLTLPEMANQTARYSINGSTPYATVTFDSAGNAIFSGEDAFFSLKHNDKITIYEITGNFTVTETENEYTTTYSLNGSTTLTEGKEATGTIRSNNNTMVSYINELDGGTPTGIRDDVRPALVGIAGAGLMLMTLTPGKKRKENG